jgi:pyruvate dehydrogenase E1 component alpha subunit
MSDPAKYRSRDELEEYKTQDPIDILKKRLIHEKYLSESEYEELNLKYKKISEQAADFAEQSENPPLSDLYEDIFT